MNKWTHIHPFGLSRTHNTDPKHANMTFWDTDSHTSMADTPRAGRTILPHPAWFYKKTPKSTASGTWTHTVISDQRILSPSCLPIPPSRHPKKTRERKTGLEPATPTLARSCSTNWAISAVIPTNKRTAKIRQFHAACKQSGIFPEKYFHNRAYTCLQGRRLPQNRSAGKSCNSAYRSGHPAEKTQILLAIRFVSSIFAYH